MRRLSPTPRLTLASLALLAGLAGAVPPARAELLDYETTFGNFYGDQPGVLDVHHWVDHLGQRVDGLHWWSSGYDELQGVAWSVYNSAGTVAHIDLRVLDGRPLQLDGFRLGSWAGAEGRAETVTVTPYGEDAPVYRFTGVIGLDNLSSRFELGLVSATGFSIAWSNPWWTAIDDIRFQAAAVPEPGTAALVFAGLAVLGLRGRALRKRHAIMPWCRMLQSLHGGACCCWARRPGR